VEGSVHLPGHYNSEIDTLNNSGMVVCEGVKMFGLYSQRLSKVEKFLASYMPSIRMLNF
jgi:hypothetical protein